MSTASASNPNLTGRPSLAPGAPDGRFRVVAGGLLIAFGVVSALQTVAAVISPTTFGGGEVLIGPMADTFIELAVGTLIVALGITVLRDRARVTTQVTSMLGLGSVVLTLPFVVQDLVQDEANIGLRGTALVLYGCAWIAVFAVSTVYLMRPRRVVPMPSGPTPPLGPDQSNWSEFLLTTLRDSGVQREEDRTIWEALAIVGLIVLYGLFCVWKLADRNLIADDNPEFLRFTFLLNLVFVLTLPPLWRFLRLQYLRATARSAEEELMRQPTRRPVLYLRSFETDKKVRVGSLGQRLGLWKAPNEEEWAAKILRGCGPVIAIGRPGEKLPLLGAARFYVSHDRWREKVADVVKVSRLVVWVTGTTEGLKWEAKHLIESCPPEKFILWPRPHQLELSGAKREKEWSSFLNEVGPFFPRPLPATLGDIGFIHFDADWTPIPVMEGGDGDPLTRTLRDKGVL